IGESSMNKVYKGFYAGTKTTVAVKVLSSNLVRDKVLLNRFEQEFRLASKLSHPHIVQALEFGWDGKVPYYVMEFVDGEDLWTRIERQGRLPEAEAIDIIIQVAEGLHEAHKHGILHRDIKPDNILVTKAGQAKLTDLGLSKDQEEDLELTRPDRGLGTPNFIAMEQFGDAKNATIRCDIYSLGATLYMALTGELPFAGDNLAEIMTKKLNNDLTPPRKLVPNLSEHVEWAIRRAIHVDPDRRFASCPEFIAALKGDANALNGNKGWKTGGRTQRPAKERRRARRYDCALPTSCTINVSVHEDETESQTSYQAQVSDLSTSGIGLLLPRRFETGSLLTVVLTSRNGDAQETRKVRVVRVSRAEGHGWFVAGVLLKELTKEELRGLL
ncbi:MAG TPA: serine/threonine-protein kinase, partial [Gemmataceae bacterium]|nr:serine/threonine-protein kinase [Gemmataceae bacterium]